MRSPLGAVIGVSVVHARGRAIDLRMGACEVRTQLHWSGSTHNIPAAPVPTKHTAVANSSLKPTLCPAHLLHHTSQPATADQNLVETFSTKLVCFASLHVSLTTYLTEQGPAVLLATHPS
jgi:hypothetical protein